MRAPTAIARSAARWARRIPSISVCVFTRRLVTNTSGSTNSSIPFARRWSARPTGNSGGMIARADAHLLARAARQLELDLVAADPAENSSSAPRSYGSRTSMPNGLTLCWSSTVTVAPRLPFAST